MVSKCNHLIENPDGTFKPYTETKVHEEAKTTKTDTSTFLQAMGSGLKSLGKGALAIGQKIVQKTAQAAATISYKTLKKASSNVGGKIMEDLVCEEDSQPPTTSSSPMPTPIDPRDQAISPCEHLSRSPFDGYQSPCNSFSSSPIDMFTRDPFGIHSQSSTNSASAPQRAHPVFFDDTLDLRRKGKRSFFDRDDESTTSNDSSSFAQRATEPFDPTQFFNFSSSSSSTNSTASNTSAPFNPNDFFDFTSSSTTASSAASSSAPTPFDPTLLFNFSSRPQTSYYSFTPYPATPNPTNL